MRTAPPSLLSQFDIRAGTVQSLQIAPESNGDFVVAVELGGALRNLVLHMHDMRGPGYQLLVDDGTAVRQVPTPPCVTYRGVVLEEPTARVVATIVDGGLTAEVHSAPTQFGPVPVWVVQPVRPVVPTAGPTVHIVYRADDNVPLPFQCGTGGLAPPQPPVAAADITLECDIACEGDVQFYQQNGSSITTTQNDITSVMNSVEFIYNRDCDIQYNISAIIVSTTAVYSTSSAGSLLNQFAARWNSVHAGVQRDVAHLFTGRNLSGSTIGIAGLATICNIGNAYGLSQSRFTSNFTARVGLTAHELGHSWSAQHCDGASPCYIMCSGLGGCNGSVSLFSPTSIAQITGFAASRGCLTIVPTAPQITSATPNSVTVFNPGNVTLSGTGFTGTTSVRIGTQNLTSGFTVVNDNTIQVSMPEALLIGSTTMSATNPQGTSNSVGMSYTITSPPKLLAPTVITGPDIAQFRFGGMRNDIWFLVVGLNNATTPFQGFPLLSSFSVIGAGVLDGQFGFGSLTAPVPGGLGFLRVYSQMLEASSLFPVVIGTTNVGLTVVL